MDSFNDEERSKLIQAKVQAHLRRATFTDTPAKPTETTEQDFNGQYISPEAWERFNNSHKSTKGKKK